MQFRIQACNSLLLQDPFAETSCITVCQTQDRNEKAQAIDLKNSRVYLFIQGQGVHLILKAVFEVF